MARTFYCHDCGDYHEEGRHTGPPAATVAASAPDSVEWLRARVADLEATVAAIRKKAADRKKRYRDRGKVPF